MMTSTTLITASSTPLQPPDGREPSAPPEWVMLIPAGDFYGRDGRGPYRLDADAVLAAYAKAGLDLPIDYDHQTLSADAKAGPVPAAGWIQALDVRDGALWGRVAWTPRASELIMSREYRYISPVFRVTKTGIIISLEGAGLTHYPNLDLEPISHAKGDNSMDDLLEQLRYLLTLPLSATAEDVIAELRKLLDKLQQAETAAQSRQPDPAQWVPMSQHKAVADELARLQADMAAQQADAAVTEAMRSGKLAPALKDWAMSYAMRDPAGFAEWVAKSPVIVSDTNQTAHSRSASDILTEEDRIACALLGISEADFASHKQTIIKE